MTISELFESLQGQRAPGGCEDCDAFQTVESAASMGYWLTVHHDDSCPTYREIRTAPPKKGRDHGVHSA